MPFAVGPLVVVTFMKFLPRGAVELSGGHIVERKSTLVQVYTDPGGIRTLAAASIRFRDPKTEVARLQARW